MTHLNSNKYKIIHISCHGTYSRLSGGILEIEDSYQIARKVELKEKFIIDIKSNC